MTTHVEHRSGPTFVIPAGLNVLAGIWLFISGWVLGFTGTSNAFWNNIILGIVVAVIALIRMGGGRATRGLGWLNALAGIWLFISPWVLNFSSNTTALWNNLILGVIVFVLGLGSANLERMSA